MRTVAKKCPIQKTAQLLSDPWTMLIMRDALEGPQRFCEFERSLEGISTRTLTLKLKRLESEGMLRKNAEGCYLATPKGKGLLPIERAMRRFGEKYL